MSSLTAKPTQSTPSSRAIPFTATLASEWTKLVTVRSTYITLALVSWASGWSWNEWSAADQAAFDPILNSLVGSIFGAILFVVLGVNLVTSEYASGMMRLTLTTTPQRGRVLMAKVIVVSAVSVVAGLVINIATFLVGQAVFAAYDMPTASMGDGDALRSIVVGIGLTSPVLPILGVATAFLFRSAAVAITAVLGIIFAPAFFGGLLPLRWQEDVLAYLPGSASDSIAIGNLGPGSPMYLDTGLAAVVLVAWLVLFVGAAHVALTRRDV